MRLPSVTRLPDRGQRIVVGATAAVALLATALTVWAALTGAIFTSTIDGTRVNQNLYDSKSDVYLNGGPQNQNGAGLPDGVYYFQVTDPSGATLLSTDHAECRQLQVLNGVVAGATGPCPHADGTFNAANQSTPVQLVPFNDTPNAGREYKVWLIPVGAAQIAPDLVTLIFANSDSKTDNFKIATPPTCVGPTCPCEPNCPPPTFTIAGEKFYDANVNGVLDPGEVGIPGWKIDADIPSNTTTDANGHYEFLNVAEGDYNVCEVIPALAPTWVPTTPTSIGPIHVGPDSLDNNFGNVCLGTGGGKTLGFWSNKNGQAAITNKVPGGLAYLNALHLRNAIGGLVVPFGSYTVFRMWLLGADATNMAYMLSAQLAAMKLNVGAGFVSGGSFVFAGTCGDNPGGNPDFISINQLMTDADNQLALHPLTTSASDPADRAIQECLKNALDDANNNKNFVQSSPCDVNYSGTESSCLTP
jgi:hypothetical protein